MRTLCDSSIHCLVEAPCARGPDANMCFIHCIRQWMKPLGTALACMSDQQYAYINAEASVCPEAPFGLFPFISPKMLQGREPWNKGKAMSAETRAKMSASHMGCKHSPATKKKMCRAHTGLLHTSVRCSPHCHAFRLAFLMSQLEMCTP